MSQPLSEKVALARVKTALQLVCASLPHLSGLVTVVRIFIDKRVATAGITQTGRLLVNPDWLARLDRSEATFVMAHELMHLCLQTHERDIGSDQEAFNWAHDYVINDMLANELERPVPKNGLVYPGARFLSAEKIMMMLRRGQLPGPRRVPRSDMTIALEEAGLLPSVAKDYGPGTNDVLSPEVEQQLFPDATPQEQEAQRQRTRAAATKAASLGVLKGRLESVPAVEVPQEPSGNTQAMMEALKRCYHTPWEMALQQWMEAVAPGPRTYARPSRREADQPDVVLAGRKREGWTLHIVLDTSGSMVDAIPGVLGAIASFCEGVGVTMIHILQCDVQVTRDEYLDPEELFRYTIAGMGGSNMTPALVHLARDPEVEAVLVLTDGAIEYPAQPMPYHILWVLTEASSFAPGYGHIIQLPKP